MCTSALAQKIWGKNVFSKLTSYGNRVVTDAQNKPVKVLGIKQAEIQIGSYLKTTFPIVVYQAIHEELLIGYTFLARFNLAVYCGKGLGTQPEVHTVKRFNFCQEQMECITMQKEYIPPRAIKVVTTKINLPETWSKQDRIATIGLPICTHSEDLEQIPVTAITCPFSYDVIGLQN